MIIAKDAFIAHNLYLGLGQFPKTDIKEGHNEIALARWKMCVPELGEWPHED